MSYLGNSPTSQNFLSGSMFFSGNGTTTAFTLNRSVSSTNDILVMVGTAVSAPNTYTVSGTTLTFTTAPASGTNNICVRYLSTTTFTVDVSDQSVNTAKIQDAAVTAAKLASTVLTPANVSDKANTSTGAFDLPAGTTAQRPVSPSVGDTRFNSTLNAVEYNNGSTWKQLADVDQDPHWANVVLSMNGGTLLDYKARHTFNAVNVSTTTTPGKPFPLANESSWYYINSGANNYIDVLGNISDFSPASYTNFTIEFWLYASGQNSSYGHFYNIGGQSGKGVIKFSGNNAYGLYWYSSNGEQINWGTTAPIGVWAHFVYEKNGSTTTTWKNGTRIAQNTNSLPAGPADYLRLGGPFSTEFSGHYFDELRITTVARYQGVATIPVQSKSWPKQ